MADTSGIPGAINAAIEDDAFSDSTDITSLGPWQDANLQATANEFASVLSDEDLPDRIRFQSGVVRLLLRKRNLGAVQTEATTLAVFLLRPPGATQAKGLTLSREPLLNNGLIPVAGRIWFVGPVVNSGKFVDHGCKDDNSVFEYVVEAIGAGGLPAMLYDPRLPDEVRYYPRGLVCDDECETFSLDGPEVTPETVFAVIERVHNECMITPDAQVDACKLWHNADKSCPAANAEARVQVHLKSGLTGAFRNCRIRHEQPAPVGRDDLEIIEHHPTEPGRVTVHAILELKVFRSFSEGGVAKSKTEAEDWVESGVKQAAAYRTDRK